MEHAAESCDSLSFEIELKKDLKIKIELKKEQNKKMDNFVTAALDLNPR